MLAITNQVLNVPEANIKIKASTFCRNIHYIFCGMIESNIDSTGVRSRKRLANERCEWLRKLDAKKIITWAIAFTPSLWMPNNLPHSVFEHVIEFIEPGESRLWLSKAYILLGIIGSEPPFQDSREFQTFLKGMYIALKYCMASTNSRRCEIPCEKNYR